MSPRVQKIAQKSVRVKNGVNLNATKPPMKKNPGDFPRSKLKRPEPKDIIVKKWKLNVEMDFWRHMIEALAQSSDSGKESPQPEMNDINE